MLRSRYLIFRYLYLSAFVYACLVQYINVFPMIAHIILRNLPWRRSYGCHEAGDYQSGAHCQCNRDCAVHENCCEDYMAVCEYHTNHSCPRRDGGVAPLHLERCDRQCKVNVVGCNST